MRLLEKDLATALGRADRAPLSIAVNADSLDTWFLPALASQDFEVELVVQDQSQSAEWLRRGEVSAAITTQGQPVQGCDVHALGALRYIATASPGFVKARFSEWLTPEAFEHAPMLRYSAQDRLQHDWAAAICGTTPTPPLITLPSTHSFVEACRLGIGWGLNPKHLADPAIANGSLEQLGALTWDTALHWQVSRVIAPALSGLTAAIRAQAKHQLRAIASSSG